MRLYMYVKNGSANDNKKPFKKNLNDQKININDQFEYNKLSMRL